MRPRFLILLVTLLVFLLGVFMLPSFAQRSSAKKDAVAQKKQIKSKSKAKATVEVNQKKINENYRNSARPVGRVEIKPKRIEPVRFAITPAVRSFKPGPAPAKGEDRMGGPPKPPLREIFNPELPRGIEGPILSLQSEDKALLKSGPVETLIPGPTLTFDGLNNIDNFNVFGFRVVPPDTNGDVGPNHYVHSVNLLLGIYDKSGTLLTPAFAMSDLFASLGGVCSTLDSGDPIVLYDQLADRWLISQFALPASPPTSQCIAISVNGDPTGSYYAYEFPMPNDKLNDYPKFGVWPDAYFMTINQFDFPVVTAFLGAGVWAYERQKMLSGDPAAAGIYIDLVSDLTLGGQLPADADGLVPPAPGAPGIIAQFAADEFGDAFDGMRFFEFDPDFVTEANTTFVELPTIPVPGFNPETPSGRTDVPQPGGAPSLDAIGDRLMHRLQYRNFGDYETFVVNHTVDADPGTEYLAAVRFYEFRRTGGTYSTNKALTLSQDGDDRWMGSAAMDVSGNIAVGYSVSSTATFPSINYSALTADSIYLGEATLQAGAGSQISTSSRWGDYSAMSVDPVDECTFWYTNEYFTVTGPELCGATTSTACWKTKVGNFSLPAGFCTTPETGTIDGNVTNAETTAPVEGARVVAVNTVTFAEVEAPTDSLGNYSRTLPPGDYTLTAKAFNYEDSAPVSITLPASGTVTTNFVLVPKGALALDSTTVDDSAGNNDGEADPNECINLTVTLENIGPGTASGISGTLVSDTDGVTVPVSTDTQTFPDTGPGGTISNGTPFQVSISPVFPCGDDIHLTLNVTTDDGPFTIPVTLSTSAGEVVQSFAYAGAPVPIPDGLMGGGDGTPVDVPITVSGATAFDQIRVNVYITHTWDGDIDAVLVGPDGTTTVQLMDDNGGSGDNFGTDCPADGNDTILDDTAATAIQSGTAPFVGSFIPIEPLANLNSQTPDGTWTLRVLDDYGFDIGTVECWTIEFVDLICEDGGGVCAGSVPVLENPVPTVSGGNGDDNIDVNECFDLSVAVTNNGTASATGVVGTLTSTTPGVTVLSGSSGYPDIAPGATQSNTTAFAVQTSEGFDCLGGDIDFNLNITKAEGTVDLPFSITPGFSLEPVVTFDSTDTPIPIPDDDAVGVSSIINVSGLTGPVGKVTVALYLTQTFNGDLVISLEGPNGDEVVLSQNNGSDSDNFGTGCPAGSDDVVFDDASATSIVGFYPGDLNPIVGVFSPQEALSAFNLIDGNGDWTLHVADVGPADLGNIECWSISIEPAVCEDTGCVTFLYQNEFDGTTLPAWTFTPSAADWTIGGGFLSNLLDKKSIGVATDFSPGCTNCTLSTTFRTTPSESGFKVWIFFHYVDEDNNIEVLFKEDKVVLKEVVGDDVVDKVKADFTLVPGQLYDVQVGYDGTNYTVTIDGVLILTYTPVGPVTGGTFALGTKKATTEWDRVQVD